MNWRTGGLAALTILTATLAGCPNSDGGMGLGGDGGTVGGTGDYSVLMRVFQGRNHMSEATAYKNRLTEVLGWRGLFVVTEGQASELYWGRFQDIDAAKPTLKRAKAYRAQNGVAVFRGAIITALPGAGGSLQQWHISQCPGKHTLLVADFVDVPEAGYIGRRQFAEEYCRQLRAEGQQAYYFHGPRASSVTIGSFGDDAFKWETRLVRQPGQSQPVKVRRGTPSSQALLALMKKFPDLAYNGRKSYNVVRDAQDPTKIIKRTPAKTYCVKVPGRQDDD